jgi:hypothetical protein
MLGMLMIRGTMYDPPQPRSGFPVDEAPGVTNMHKATNRSPSTFAYDVNTSANKMSPNLPSCASAIPPMHTRFKVERKRKRPDRERDWMGRKKTSTRRKRYD